MTANTSAPARTGGGPATAGHSHRAGAARWLRRWGALAVVLAGTFMVVLDFFIVNVAIPAIQRGLQAGPAAIQFVVAGYGLALAAGQITGGRLGDIHGPRRMFAAGLALFILASAGCGLAPSAGLLVLARVAQGAAAALMSPQVLAILGFAYTGRDRARAFTAYGLTLGIAAVSGQLIGGLLIRADIAGLGWRACFLVNVPVGIAALAAAPRLVPERAARTRSRLDLPGTALVTAGLVAVVLPLVEGQQQGWPAWTWLSFAAAAGLLALFAVHQRWLGARGGAPLIELAMFRERGFTAGITVTVAFWTTMASFFLVLALYLQVGRGLDALRAGLVFSSIGAGFLVTSIVSPRLAARMGRQCLAVGTLVMAAGVTWLAVAVARAGTSGRIAGLISALFVDGAGMGLITAPLTATVLAGVTPRRAGAAAGIVSTAIQVGNALGVAIVGVIFYRALGQAPQPQPAAYVHAFGASLVYLGAVAVAVTALVQALPRPRR